MLLQQIEECAKEVYKILGPGHNESVYHEALLIELRLNNIVCESEYVIPIHYKGKFVGNGRADIVAYGASPSGVNGHDLRGVVVELKAVNDVYRPRFYSKIKSYMRFLDIDQGLLINFPQRSNINSANIEVIPLEI